MSLTLPKSGVQLPDFSLNGRRTPKQQHLPHALLLQLPAGVSQDRLRRVLGDADGQATVQLGSKPSLTVGDHAFDLQPEFVPRGLLYRQQRTKPDADTPPAWKPLASLVSAKRPAATATTQADDHLDLENNAAVQALQQSLQQAQQAKQARTAIFVNDSRTLLPKNKKHPTTTTASTPPHARPKSHRVGLFNARSGVAGTSSSLPTSPARQPTSRNASPSVGGLTPRPQPADSAKQQALRVAFLHLLAVRAVSEKFLLQTLHCDATDLRPLLDKFGRTHPFDGSKYNLSDRGYRDLDVWSFPYSDPEDRQSAIDRAVAAFDRLRIGVEEPIWQRLLPMKERGTGKTLSRLRVGTEGRIERIGTPKINVSAASESPSLAATKGIDSHGSKGDSDRKRKLDANDQDRPSSMQSPSWSASKKQKMSSNRDAAARILAKPKAKSSQTTASAKAQSLTDASKKKQAPPGKRTTSKAPPVTSSSSKIKSAEFVVDSDEDDDEPLASASPTSPRPHSRQSDGREKFPVSASNGTTDSAPKVKLDSKSKPARSPALLPTKGAAAAAAERLKVTKTTVTSKKSASPRYDGKTSTGFKDRGTASQKRAHDSAAKLLEKAPEKRAADPTHGGRLTPSEREVAKGSQSTSVHRRTGSSNVKPSSMGASPPTRSTEAGRPRATSSAAGREIGGPTDRDGNSSKSSSSSTSPLMNALQQRQRLEALPRTLRDIPTNKPLPKNIATSDRRNGGGSDRTLKRKANDLDHDVHAHKTFARAHSSSTGSRTSDAQSRNGDGSVHKGHAAEARPTRVLHSSDTGGDLDAEGSRPSTTTTTTTRTSDTRDGSRSSSTSPATAASSGPGGIRARSSSSGTMPSSTARNGVVPDGKASTLISAETIAYSQSFKTQQARYAALRRELLVMAEPPPDKIERLQRMHDKLIQHKAEIARMIKA